MRLQLTCKAGVKHNQEHGSTMLMFTFHLGPLEVFCLAHLPRAGGDAKPSVYVKVTLKGRTLVDAGSKEIENWTCAEDGVARLDGGDKETCPVWAGLAFRRGRRDAGFASKTFPHRPQVQVTGGEEWRCRRKRRFQCAATGRREGRSSGLRAHRARPTSRSGRCGAHGAKSGTSRPRMRGNKKSFGCPMLASASFRGCPPSTRKWIFFRGWRDRANEHVSPGG